MPKNLSKREKEIRLMYLERAEDNGDANRKIHQEARYLRKQVHRPTIRQRLFGYKSGRLRKEDQDFLDVMVVAEKIRADLSHP